MDRRRLINEHLMEVDEHTLALLHFENGANYDEVTKSDSWSLSTNGSPGSVISGGKFGNSCWKTLGSNTKARGVSKNFYFANSFTVDFWVKDVSFGDTAENTTSVSNVLILFSNLYFGRTKTWKKNGTNNYTQILNASLPVGSSWKHVAIVYDGAKLMIFHDGVKQAEATIGLSPQGRIYPSGDKNEYSKYHGSLTIDEFRVSDIARWTEDFTPPTKPYSVFKEYTEDEDWFYLYARESGTFSFNLGADFRNTFRENGYLKYIEYSIDGGETWTHVSAEELETNGTVVTPSVEQWGKVYWRGSGTALGYSSSNTGSNCYFSSSGLFDVGGNIMSLLGKRGKLVSSYTFKYLFGGRSYLVSASSLKLPINLTPGCFYGMFYNCTGLRVAPKLPALKMESYCYAYMFYGCTSLTSSPVLAAANLTSYCYSNMFNGCSSLNYVTALFVDSNYSSNTSNWLKNVSSSGTFYYNSAESYSTSPKPSGWTAVAMY